MTWPVATFRVDTGRSENLRPTPIIQYLLRHIAWAVLLMVPGACLGEHTTHNVPVSSVLPWLSQEHRSLEEILRTLGQAQASLEDGRILLWQITDDGTVLALDQTSRTNGLGLRGPFNLVIVLDRPDPELAKIQRIRMVRTEGSR